MERIRVLIRMAINEQRCLCCIDPSRSDWSQSEAKIFSLFDLKR